MTSARLEQFRVEMPDGLVIERLPIGLARGVWRLAFVASGRDFFVGDPSRAVDFHREFWDRVRFDGVGAPLESLGGEGGGGRHEQEFQTNLLDNGMVGLRITYIHETTEVASEIVRLID